MFHDFLWSDPDPAKRFGSDRIRFQIRLRLCNTEYGTRGCQMLGLSHLFFGDSEWPKWKGNTVEQKIAGLVAQTVISLVQKVSFQGRFADLVFFGIDIVLRKIYLKETFKKIDLYYIVILYFRDVV